jgi:hypothetical protein
MRLLITALISLFVSKAACAATLAGQQVQPGGKIEIRFPVSQYFQGIAAQAGNPRPETGRAVRVSCRLRSFAAGRFSSSLPRAISTHQRED